jgi:hypothetical protein
VQSACVHPWHSLTTYSSSPVSVLHATTVAAPNAIAAARAESPGLDLKTDP